MMALKRAFEAIPLAAALVVTASFINIFTIHAVAAVTPKKYGDITTQRLSSSDREPGQWFTSGRDWRQNYYSPLANINKSNIKQLGHAWSYDLKIDVTLASTPVVVDGVMFTSGNRGKVYALDAKTGVLRWSFEPKVDPEVVNCCGGINRGVAVWRGKVYVAATDGRLYALDAATGKSAWDVDTIIDHERSYSSTGAPYIAGDVVVIGNSGAEYDTRGYITAYKLDTGEQAWRFFIVPGDPQKGFEHPELEMAAKTWDPASLWYLGLGGNAWDGMAYDPQLNLLYVGTGNALPWNRKLRSPAGGDNLFLSSILAINPDTGRLVWHYQTTPGDNWDYNAAQKIILAELMIDGKSRPVLMQAPKNGFFYVLDRRTGELISAKPYVYVNWASHVDMKTGRPVETGRADYSKAPKLVFPTNQGGHNWQPMAFNPNTGLVYIPTLEAGEVQGNLPYPFAYQKRVWNNGVEIRRLIDWENPECGAIPAGWPTADALRAGEPDPSPRTFLRAWDPVQQKLVWQIETTGPIASADYGARRTAGVMTTAAGLVFVGDSRGQFRVFDAENGAQLHSIDIGTSMSAAPMTYTVDGEQYVAIMAGSATPSPVFVDYRHPKDGRIVALKLGGGRVPARKHEPGQEEIAGNLLAPPLADTGSPSELEQGQQLFERICAACHMNTGRAPNLARMTAEVHKNFLSIVRGGARAEKGMPNFGSVLSEQDAQAIHAYVVHAGWKRYRCQSIDPARRRGM